MSKIKCDAPIVRRRVLRAATKCKHADRYKAVYPPRCGCDICDIKWRIAELERKFNNDDNWL